MVVLQKLKKSLTAIVTIWYNKTIQVREQLRSDSFVPIKPSAQLFTTVVLISAARAGFLTAVSSF